MDTKWSLKELYTAFDSAEYQQDLKTLDMLLANIGKWTSENLSDQENATVKLETYVKMLSEFETIFSKLASFAHLTMSTDAKNAEAIKYTDLLESKIPDFTAATIVMEKWIGALESLDAAIESSQLLKEHGFIINEIAQKTSHLLSDKEEILMARMKNTGSNAWSKLQGTLTSTLLVDIKVDGEEKHLPLPVVRNMAYDKNPEVRKNAYDAELKSYEKIDEAVAACLNGIKGEVITEVKLRGYKSALERTLLESRMDFETLDAMLSAMKESLPAFRSYFRKKAEIMDKKNGLPFYDMFAPMGSLDKTFTYEEARDFIVKNFATFSKELSDFAKNAFDKCWIDAEPREGKRGGAFCSNLMPIKESRVLTNFTGSLSDVITLAHELGHAYHGSCLVDESILNCSYPMPIAETASIFCETIVNNAVLKTATEEETFTILEGTISDAAQVIVDIYSRYLFETELFKRRENGSLSVAELKEIMLAAQKEAYGEGLDENQLHPYMWVCKPHYYYSSANFYNFPYAFGLLFAKGLYAEYIKRGESFIDDYKKLLSVTGKNKIADITAMMGIDIHSVDFWRSSLKLIEKDIKKFINLK